MSKPINRFWIQERILILRKQKVMLSTDLAEMYEVPAGRLVEAVRRNIERFPVDFMFQLSDQEFRNLKSQFAISSWGGVRTPPYAFTELGIATLSSVLRSPKAIQMNIEIMREFVALRKMLMTHQELADRLGELEKKYDQQFRSVFEAIRTFVLPTPAPNKTIGIHTGDDESE